ncbi:MAG TPA: large conductance mechanosensitive channel protein MscL [Candidatus Limnocylindrales bacterium]
MLGEFRAFLLKTNALALAIGVIIGAALGAVVTSLVNDIIMPPVGLVLGGVDFKALRVVLQDNADPAKVVAINYGTFINSVIAFIVIAFVVFWVARTFIKDAPATPVQTCPYCKEPNDVAATRCKACTSDLRSAVPA